MARDPVERKGERAMTHTWKVAIYLFDADDTRFGAPLWWNG